MNLLMNAILLVAVSGPVSSSDAPKTTSPEVRPPATSTQSESQPKMGLHGYDINQRDLDRVGSIA